MGTKKGSGRQVSVPEIQRPGWGLEPGLFYIPDTLKGYEDLVRYLESVRASSMDSWKEIMRWYCRHDLFLLLNYVLSDGKKIHSDTGKPLHWHPYYLNLCRWVQSALDEYLPTVDASARSCGKSTVRTKAATIQAIIRNPNIAVCIFSVEKSLAKRHFSVIMEELDSNGVLKWLFDDILWEHPRDAAKSGATVWSRDDGICVKRGMVRANYTVEYHTFVGASPTGSRFDVVHYDDVENEKVTSSPEMLEKVVDSFNASVALATGVAIPSPVIFVTNTIYHQGGVVNKKMLEYKRKSMDLGKNLVRIDPAEDLTEGGDGPLGGAVRYPFSSKILNFWFETFAYNKSTYGTQFCCSFTAIADNVFRREWIQYYKEDRFVVGENANIYICIDPSSGVVDPTAVVVWAACKDGIVRLVDGIREKMDPSDPCFHDRLCSLVDFWRLHSKHSVVVMVEQGGPAVWAELIRSELTRRGNHVQVIPVRVKGVKGASVGFGSAKREREWNKWAPNLRMGKVEFPVPASMGGAGIPQKDGTCLVDYIIESELMMFPKCRHDDCIDAGMLIWDNDFSVRFPSSDEKSIRYVPRIFGVSWMSAG